MEKAKLKEAKELLAEVKEEQREITKDLNKLVSGYRIVEMANKMIQINKLIGKDTYIKERVPVLMWYTVMHMYIQKLLEGLEIPLEVNTEEDYDILEKSSIHTEGLNLKELHADLQERIEVLSSNNIMKQLHKFLGVNSSEEVPKPKDVLDIMEQLFSSDM